LRLQFAEMDKMTDHVHTYIVGKTFLLVIYIFLKWTGYYHPCF